MSFKDKKEEVIELRLTSYGKHLLSMGMLKPSYYAFYDDEIIYDSRYCGNEEEQNYSEDRILTETPTLGLQTNFTGLETQIEHQIEQRRSGNMGQSESIQATKERNYALSAPLGTSSPASEYNPSWDITVYGQQFKQKFDTKQSQDHATLKIPQMNLGELEYKTYVSDEIHGTIRQELVGHDDDDDLYQVEYPNGKVVNIEHAEIILEIDELHTDAMYHNYDIEVFIIDDATGEEVLVPLSFLNIYEENANVVNGILKDVEPGYDEFEPDETYVENYLQIDTDLAVDRDMLCRLGYTTDYTKRGYIRVDCDERTGRDRMSEIYEIDETPEPFGDDC